jgi:DNA-binding MarR family transcriptional regulator
VPKADRKVDAARDEEVLLRLLDLFERMRTHWVDTCSGQGLTPAEGHALHRLESPAPMRAMAEALSCDASYVTQLTDRLESASLVERAMDPNDRRVRQLRLTPRGATARTDLIKASHVDNPALAALTTKQRDEFLALLRVLEHPSAGPVYCA